MSASILIVDDDPQVTRVCEIALKQAGYSVATVEDGRKALEALTTLDFDAGSRDARDGRPRVSQRTVEGKVRNQSGGDVRNV